MCMNCTAMFNPKLMPVAGFTAFLAILEEAGPIPSQPEVVTFSSESFVEDLNEACQYVYQNYFTEDDAVECLTARDTGCTNREHRTTKTECRPNIALAFKSRWVKHHETWRKGKTGSWPWTELVGERATPGSDNKEVGIHKTFLNSHYWLLARPDRLAALSFLSTHDGVTFLVVMQGSSHTYTLSLDWDSSLLSRLVFAFIYRLYCPGTWAIPHFKRKFVENRPLFDITIDGKTYENFRPVFASRPFNTRTHVCANSEKETVDSEDCVSVIKSQLSLKSTRFVEEEVYKQVHRDWHVPGVPHAHLLVELSDPTDEDRCYRLLGLEEYGSPIMEAATLRDVLEILFDILEVLRYLYFERNVLHRDISKGNVLIVKHSSTPTSDPTDHKGVCFFRHLLDPKVHPHTTRAMLIDFNNAEILGDRTKRNEDSELSIGTPGFVSRAVEKKGPLPFSPRILVPDIPSAPVIYANAHPARVAMFPSSLSHEVPQEPKEGNAKAWRHDLDHDAESVFWLLFYWLVSAQPLGKARERIRPYFLSCFTEGWAARHCMVSGLMNKSFFHSSLWPAVDLLQSLADVITPDRSWLSEQDPRNRAEYTLEASQRLILTFFLANDKAEFMTTPIDVENPRVSETHPQVSESCRPAIMDLSKAQTCAKRKGDDQTHANKRPRLKTRPSEASSVNSDLHQHGDSDDDEDSVNDNEDEDEDEDEDDRAPGPPDDGELEIWEALQPGQKIIICWDEFAMKYVTKVVDET